MEQGGRVGKKLMQQRCELDAANSFSGRKVLGSSRKDRAMNKDPITPEGPDEVVKYQAQRPRATAWLWRPVYARFWWACIALYWAGKLGSYWSPELDAFFSNALAGYLNIAFFPPIASAFLGVGYVRAWMNWAGREWGPAPQNENVHMRSVGGWRDPYSDPLDPRSGSLWIGSPEHQADLFHRKWP